MSKQSRHDSLHTETLCETPDGGFEAIDASADRFDRYLCPLRAPIWFFAGRLGRETASMTTVSLSWWPPGRRVLRLLANLDFIDPMAAQRQAGFRQSLAGLPKPHCQRVASAPDSSTDYLERGEVSP